MTDQEKDKLIVEALGECWHEFPTPYSCICQKCGYYAIPQQLTDPDGFFWTWERAQKMEWWESFCRSLWILGPFNPVVVPSSYIEPTRFRDALAEFLERRKG